jgi:hypothetical protein
LSAGTIQGTLTITALGATLDTTNVNTATVITPVSFQSSQVLAGSSTGDFSLIPLATAGSGGVVNLANLSSYSLVFASYGTFSASGGTVIRNSGGFLDVLYTGTFTPATNLTNAGITAGSASVLLNINQNGASVSYGGTLSAPAAGIPEPSTYGLTAFAVSGLFLLKRRLPA